LKIMDFDGPVPFRWVGFNFIPGTGPAKKGLLPGQCTWLDREMRPGEPGRLAQPIEKTFEWNKELNSSDSYWTFNVYNAGDQLQATGAERSKKPDIDYTKLGDSIPGGDKFAVARTNVALAANGGVASASSFTPDTEIPGYEFRPSSANDGNISGSTFPHNGFWRDGTDNVWPDWLQIDFAVSKIIEIDVYSVQDTIDTTGPTDKVEGLPFTINGIVDFEVQYWDGSAWQPIPGTMVKGNTRVLNKFILKPAITTTAIRVYVTAALNKRSRIVELEAWK
ncbi:MAG: discoidin domain-containing protein, partial [Pyrinomonadaceae bacterium]